MGNQEYNELQTKIHMTLDRFSNSEPVEVNDEWIEEAGEAFKESLRRQFKPREEDFRLRMSNVGRPLCQLQQEAKGTERTRMPYNHVVRMLIGDAVEAAMLVIIKASGINITSNKDKVSLQVNDTLIRGETDFDIDGEVWDVKSTAPWAFANKWSKGWNGVYDDDTFGYVAQLYGYSEAQEKPLGGWIVVDKSSGEVKVVRATPTPDQLKQIKASIEFTERALHTQMPFKRGFEEEVETFYKKPTGNMKLPVTCTFCPYIRDCWPNAVRKPRAGSKSENPPTVWYSKYVEEEKK